MQKLSDIMTKNVETIRPDASILEVAERMRSQDVGALPVCENDRLVGLVTDRDIVVRALASRKDFRNVRVSDVMSRGIEYCFEDESIQDAAEHMQDKQLRRLVVLNKNKRLVGIVSLGDLAAQTGKSKLAGKTLEEISSPGHEASSKFFKNSFLGNFSFFSMIGGASLFLGYLVFQQRPELRDRLRKVVPLNREQKIA